ncbi:MAG: hypothetical protein GY747_09070 [Planctomycetes bacterium]|nr:hypothetical protein [Planctomycetota bacterium]MCP4771339.1 hypothetical protein [Planctomycetota bacterium]MCP4860427.1 hypothetical protein [Planctomycetota bacterium]
MLFLPTKPVASPAAGTSILRINREDISFETLPGRVVLLSVTVHNDSDAPSEPTTMRVNAAPLGVFLPSRQVGRVAVPAIAPRSKMIVESAYAAPTQRGLSGTRLRAERKNRRESVLQLLANRIPVPNREREVLPGASPRSRLSALLDASEGSFCWAGNFDVHVRTASAERHMQGKIQLQAGAQNMGLFEVGDGKHDRYRFEFYGNEHAQNWSPTFMNQKTGVWLPFGKKMVLFALHPPTGAVEGCLAAEVTRESTGKSAMVEFGFGADTIPPGCYVGR